MKGPGGIGVDPEGMLDIQADIDKYGTPVVAVIIRNTDGKGGPGETVHTWEFEDEEVRWLLDLMVDAFAEYHHLVEYQRLKATVEAAAKSA